MGLASQLQRVVTFDFLGLVRYEPEQGLTRPWVLETASMMFTTRLELPIEEHPAGWVIKNQRPLIVADTSAETRWPQIMTRIRHEAIASFCLLPLTTARGPLGALVYDTFIGRFLPAEGEVGETVEVPGGAPEQAARPEPTT